MIVVSIALCFGFFVELKKRGDDSLFLATWKYFSYYTILTNLLVFIWISVQVFYPHSNFALFALDHNVSAAVTFYILTVGLANYLLYGWQVLTLPNRIYDLLVHAVTPILTFCYWFFYLSKIQLTYEYIPYWLIYPLTYAVYTTVHGNWTKFYPYDFTNIDVLGAKKVALNAFSLSVGVLLGASAFVFVSKNIG
tara:strand:- start:24086 stop:24667 length:582 start_codon:yes stop_codon:yes gene_type:complete